MFFCQYPMVPFPFVKLYLGLKLNVALSQDHL